MKYNPAINIKCRNNVYEPAEDSLLLLEILKIRKDACVLDMGTGTSIIALHCAAAGCKVVAVDVDPIAVSCARRNAKLNNCDIKIIKSDLFAKVKGKFDAICFNPPYLPSDGSSDHVSWTGGRIGNELTMKFLKQAKNHLVDRGIIYIIASFHTGSDETFETINKLGYDVKVEAKKEFFFESLYGLKITKR